MAGAASAVVGGGVASGVEAGGEIGAGVLLPLSPPQAARANKAMGRTSIAIKEASLREGGHLLIPGR